MKRVHYWLRQQTLAELVVVFLIEIVAIMWTTWIIVGLVNHYFQDTIQQLLG